MGGVFQLFQEGVGISRNWATAHFLILMVSLGTVIAPVGVSFSLLMSAYTEAQGLVQVDLSAILDTFGSNQFMSCPRAISFFQRLCPAPIPPVLPVLDGKWKRQL